VFGEQNSSLGIARGTKPPLLAGECNKFSVVTGCTSGPGATVRQHATIKEGCKSIPCLAAICPILVLVALLPHPLELLVIVIHRSI